MERPRRKKIRLQTYDYRQNGGYFVTICTEKKKPLFGMMGNPTSDAACVGADSISARMVAEGLHRVLLDYPGVSCPKFVVMPNHFHGIFLVERADMESAPTLSQVIQAFKRYTTIQYVKLVKEGRAPSFDQRVWQRSFYDHVLRSEADYQRVWRYIDENPAKWAEDEYYSEGAIP